MDTAEAEAEAEAGVAEAEAGVAEAEGGMVEAGVAEELAGQEHQQLLMRVSRYATVNFNHTTCGSIIAHMHFTCKE